MVCCIALILLSYSLTIYMGGTHAITFICNVTQSALTTIIPSTYSQNHHWHWAHSLVHLRPCAMTCHLQQTHVHKHFSLIISQHEWCEYHNSQMHHHVKHCHSYDPKFLQLKSPSIPSTLSCTAEVFHHLQHMPLHIHSFSTAYTKHITLLFKNTLKISCIIAYIVTLG